jgi:hypothetical protein
LALRVWGGVPTDSTRTCFAIPHDGWAGTLCRPTSSPTPKW